jgi:hypothetical protein
MIQNKLDRLLDTVLNPQGHPVPRRRADSVFVKAPGNKEEKAEGQASYDIEPLSLAPRLDTLDGKTVYLVDGKFGGGYSFLVEMQDWLSRNMPAVKTVLRRKAGNMFMDDPDLWAEIKEKGDAVVLGVGG